MVHSDFINSPTEEQKILFSLRLGNIVSDGDNIYCVASVDLSRIYGCPLIINDGSDDDAIHIIHSPTPIALTAEWLEKFGFYEKYKNVHSHWSKGGVGIEQASDQDDDGNTIHPAPQEFSYQWNFNIPFVHTLQNLYHSLTGEELTINL